MTIPLKYFPPKLDVVFKALFGKERNKALLASLLSGVLNIPMEEIIELELLNTELMPDYPEFKSSRLDILVKVVFDKSLYRREL